MHPAWLSCRQFPILTVPVCLPRRSVLKGRTGALGVVELDPAGNHAPSMEAILDFSQINGFLLQWPPQPLDEDVVHAASAPIHRLPGSGIEPKLSAADQRRQRPASVLKRGLQWRDAPPEYGPHKTLYNRFVRWSRMGVFDRIFKELSSQDVPDQLQMDAPRLKAHRTAASLLEKGMLPEISAAPKAG